MTVKSSDKTRVLNPNIPKHVCRRDNREVPESAIAVLQIPSLDGIDARRLFLTPNDGYTTTTTMHARTWVISLKRT